MDTSIYFKLTKKLKFEYNKVPSAMITNLKFLSEVAKEKKKLLFQLECVQ